MDLEGSFLSLTDEEGNEFELEFVDMLEYNGQRYMAFLPPEDGDPEAGPDDGTYGYIILRVEVQPDGEEMLVTVDDAAEEDAVFELLMDDVNESYFGDDEDDEED